ncbi:hypothetical protein KXW39_008910 [Aspergillus fumigatus]|nr:hypothetical protein KXX18_008950 [Aspergillus fumigatus]KAH1953858.1 hypothetical protein KXV90_009349 [Aspergillus fumigatus]KAH2897125.1 hypothetical protein KXV75_001840 [Aspergillus fumigatus]KAH3173863.1 hypothetical protein KXW84_001911 [Aspergillus fumigatus]KAH3303284.1 hypothetical protein KXV87_001967 [Aspergillus fumigatus]
MESSTCQVPHGDEETIECWDDDGDLHCYEDIHIRTASTATSVTNVSTRRSGHRDSISSRRSTRSDLDSNAAEDEDLQVQLPDDDEDLSEDAIASAKNAGIPLPVNVPKSALIGGTIKRLGRRKPRKNFIDDWSDDVELPGPDAALELKKFKDTVFPETLRQLSSATNSPVKRSPSPLWEDDLSTRLQSALTNLSQFTDDSNHSLADIDKVPTIKVAKPRSPKSTKSITEHNVTKIDALVENVEDDFELPADDFPLHLSLRKDGTEATSTAADDFDLDWSEGSIGIRFGGTKRDHRSIPSSAVSVVSPSASSCRTGESEDEGLDGLVIPEGPLDLESMLKKRQSTCSTDKPRFSPSGQAEYELTSSDDFFAGLEIESGDAFDLKKLSLNPNVKYKVERPSSPARRSTTSITFTNTAVSPRSRIPRLFGHDRHSTHLETVSESGAPLSKFPGLRSWARGHVNHASISSLPSRPISTSPTPSTPARRSVTSRSPKTPLSSDRATSGTQPLRNKRSMPTIRSVPQSAHLSYSQGSLSREDESARSSISHVRARMPGECAENDSRFLSRKAQTPFIPAGASETQSHHVNVKGPRHFRRTNSDGSSEIFSSRVRVSRYSRSGRHSISNSVTDESQCKNLITAAKQTITRPTRRRNFGDGTELELFDDLPTSSLAESKFIKHPIGRGVPRSLRSRLGHNQTRPSRTEVLKPPSTSSTVPTSCDLTPRFARDTNASRNAREQRIASMAFSLKSRESNPLGPLSSNSKNPNIARAPSNPATLGRKTRGVTASGGKPFLIKSIGKGSQEPKCVNGMQYNPDSFQWEGNETSVIGFDSLRSPKSPKPAPALITNVSAMQNVQVVGGMVFDPRRMCWLKLASSQPGAQGMVAVQVEDDVFAGLDDLEEKSQRKPPGGPGSGSYDVVERTVSGDEPSCGDSSDEWPMTEEFDVGPEFVRRQRVEEEKWRRKVEKWVHSERDRHGNCWRWAIRDIVGVNGSHQTQEVRRM